MEQHTFIGNIGQDPELRDYQGRSVLNLSMALDKSYKNSDGQKVEKTRWIRLTAWGARADTLAKYVQKGDQLYVECNDANHDIYNPQDGEPRLNEQYTISSFQFLRNGRNGNGASSNGTTNEAQGADEVGDVPF